MLDSIELRAVEAQRVADQREFPRGQAQEIPEELFATVKADVVAGEDVTITGFGKWCVMHKQARRGRNPKTGEPMI